MKEVSMFREEKDQLGTLNVPLDALYGIHSLRSHDNFNLNNDKTHPSLIQGLIIVKKACAISNAKANLLDRDLSQAIVKACDLILNDYDFYSTSFITHPLQGGAGTSTNMNVNEVIANVALLHLGYQAGDYHILHPLNHVNMSQSTNDVYPTGLKIAAIRKVRLLADALASLQSSLQQKENDFSDILKLGRTQLMDALPITLGQEFGAYARCISRDRWRIYKVEERLREVNIGGTAVGTGMNAPLIYIYSVTEELQRLTGLGIARSDLLIDSTQNMDVFTEVSGLLKALATNLIKIANDLRLLASGPIGGFGEIHLKAHQAGSSIMPGKVNPVIPEMINQIAFKVIGSDTSITYAASSGQLELNAFTPLIANELLNSLDLLVNGITIFDKECIQTLTADKKRCESMATRSYSLAAAFIHLLGYDVASDIAKEAYEQSLSIKEVLMKKKLLTEAEIDSILSIHQLTQPGIPGKR
jgi:aspartate ammonia-lyase